MEHINTAMVLTTLLMNKKKTGNKKFTVIFTWHGNTSWWWT